MDTSKYILNLQKSPYDSRDFIVESVYPDAVTLPEEWDLRPQMRFVRDQGTQGTCSAQAAAAMKEWQESMDVQFNEMMSPQFVYNLRQNQGESGMWPRDTMDILYKIGIVPEKDYHYGTFDPISDELKQKAANYKIEGYAQVNTIDALKKALFMNGPAYIAFPVYRCDKLDFWNPDHVGQQILGGHATTCVGYLKDCFIIRNSWSEAWGINGHCYYYFSQFGMHWEIWTSIDSLSNNDNLIKKTNEFKRQRKEKSFFRKIFKKTK